MQAFSQWGLGRELTSEFRSTALRLVPHQTRFHDMPQGDADCPLRRWGERRAVQSLEDALHVATNVYLGSVCLD